MASTVAPSRELEAILAANIPPDKLARLTGRSERTARRWLTGETSPRGAARRQLAEISGVVDAFAKTFPGGDVGSWLERRDPELDYATPAELIAEGRTREVLALLLAIGEGVYL
jgi:transcriptional regulator with XRE-family HTH domain